MHVFLIAAISLDGFIAEKNDQISTAWTSKEDKKFFSERTKQAGVVVMGSSTYNTIGRPLPGRVNIVYSTKIVSNKLSNLEPGQIGYTNLPPKQLIDNLKQWGYQEVAICGGASIYSMFMKAGLIDTLYLTIEPVIFGEGIKLFTPDVQSTLQLVKVEKMGANARLIEYKVKR